MNKLSVEYVKSIRENLDKLPDGYQVLKEGEEIGRGIEMRKAFSLKKADMRHMPRIRRIMPKGKKHMGDTPGAG